MSKWSLVRIDEICEVNPKIGRGVLSPDTLVSFLPMAAVAENGGGIINVPERAYHEVSKGYTYFQDNDVLFAKITPCMENGKVVIAKNLKNNIGFGSTEFHVRCSSEVLPKWIFAFLIQPSYREQARRNFTGTAGQQRVPTDFIKNSIIPLPPLPEQERIVRLLDEAEALRATRKRANVRMGQFVPALFQELFDTASNEIISNSNNDWKEMKLGDVCSFIRGPFGGSLKKNVFKSDGYAVYEQRHAIHKDYSEIRYFINEEKFKEMARFELHPGELIMSCSGVTLGRVSIAPENIKPGIINQALLKLTPSNKKISVEFLKIWMESESFQVSIRKYSQGAAIPNVASVKILKDIPIYLPPLALQREFAARVEAARGVQSAQARSAERIEALYQSMLSRAFAGEL